MKRFSRYAPLLFWMAFILFASSGEFSAASTSKFIRPLFLWLFPDITEERMVLMHFLTRKAAHFIEYAVLASLAARAFSTSSLDLLRRFWRFAALALVVFYSIVDEFHQSFVPSRTGSVLDSIIDISGGVTALVIFAYWQRRRANNYRALTAEPAESSS